MGNQKVQGGSAAPPNPQHTNSFGIKSTFWIWKHRKSLFNYSQMFGGGGGGGGYMLSSSG